LPRTTTEAWRFAAYNPKVFLPIGIGLSVAHYL
jgi:hypothetical protein